MHSYAVNNLQQPCAVLEEIRNKEGRQEIGCMPTFSPAEAGFECSGCGGHQCSIAPDANDMHGILWNFPECVVQPSANRIDGVFALSVASGHVVIRTVLRKANIRLVMNPKDTLMDEKQSGKSISSRMFQSIKVSRHLMCSSCYKSSLFWGC